MTDFAERLNELLKISSQKEISESTGISQASISLYLSKKRKPASDSIIKIADFFNVTTDYLLGLSNTPNKSGDLLEDYQKLKEKAEKFEELKDSLLKITKKLR